MKRLIVSMLVAGMPFTVHADADCRFQADRSTEAATDAIKHVIVRAGAGELRIDGEAGRRSVLATGAACAPSEQQLEKMQVRISREGDTLVVATEIPEGLHPMNWFRGDGWIDLAVRVPAGISIDVEDSSGAATIVKVGSTRVTDGSGDLTIEHISGGVIVGDGSGQTSIRDVHGPIRIADGSGDVVVTEVMGEITVTNDGSGEITISDVQGSVTIGDDGSGDIRVGNVSGSVKIEDDASGGIFVNSVRHDVTILRDGSGEIEVVAVDGDFSVEQAGSGGIKHERVGGSVRLAGDVKSND